MDKLSSRNQFVEYCLRRLGKPVVEINLSPEQIDDRIDDALQYFQDYHFEGCEKIYMKHMFTQEDIDRRWIYCPEPIIFVQAVLPFDDSNSSINMFDLRYQLRLHDLYDFTSVSYVSYEITMQHIRTLNLLFSGTPQFRFNRHQNKLFLDIDWTRDAELGRYVIIECYRALTPDTIQLTGTVSGNAGTTALTGTNTKFPLDIVENDYITLSDGQSVQVRKIVSDTSLTLATPLANTVLDVSMTMPGLSAVWNNRFLKQYATALIKKNWGESIKKFGNIQMPGGVILNGKEIWEEATEEIRKLEEEMESYNILPSEMMMG